MVAVVDDLKQQREQLEKGLLLASEAFEERTNQLPQVGELTLVL
jgi:hypothetical protein